jgi:cytochrome c553
MQSRMLLVVAFLVVASSWGVSGGTNSPRMVDVPDNPPAKNAPMPTDASMHDFMEAVFQGPYRRLKVAIATEPKDNAGWKVIRSEALILAEGGNLLLMRKPEKDADKWTEYSIASRDAGAEVFKAAKKKDHAEAKKAYEKMLTACNACHKQFDNGKNQLMP